MFNFTSTEQFVKHGQQNLKKESNFKYVGIQLPILTKFGMIFDLFEEIKKSSDGSTYVQHSIMIRIIPGKKPGEYDNEKAFTMKTKIEDVYAFAGALFAAYNGKKVSYSILTDSSKNIFTDKAAQKTLYITSTDEKITIGATCKYSDNQKISDGVSIDRYKAYGIAKSIEDFCKSCHNYIFKRQLKINTNDNVDSDFDF